MQEFDAYFEQANQDGTIKAGVANNLGFPTVSMVEGKVIGSSPEIAYRFAQKYGYNLEISFMEFGALIPALQSGKIDFAISNITVTPERAEQVDFAVPYDGGGLAILALKERLPEERPSLESARIGVMVGSTNLKDGVITGMVVERLDKADFTSPYFPNS